MAQLHDVVIVGAGPGGSAAAAFLARQGLDVMLLDKTPFPRDKACGDLLSPGSISILEGLGVAPTLHHFGFPVNTVGVISPNSEIVTGSLPLRPPFPHHGLVIKRFVLDDLIRQAAINAGVRFEDSVHVRDVQLGESEGTAVIGVRSGRQVQYRGRLVILAVGANVPLLQSLALAPRRVRFSFAARAYFEGVRGLNQQARIHFDGVPLPGGGWIFPLSSETANVGAGFYTRSRAMPPNPAAVLTGFLAHPTIRPYFEGANRISPVKGFPLRMDFHRSPTTGQRILLVGEAAGLVNPLTGEGIYYALQSAMLAIRCITACFQRGDFSPMALRSYDRALRTRFQKTFVLAHWLRRLYMNPLMLDAHIRACSRWPDVYELMVNMMLSYQEMGGAFNPGVIFKVLRCLQLRKNGMEAVAR